MSTRSTTGDGRHPPTRRRPGRERLLVAMDQLFYRDGFSSAVVDRLIDEAGVARGTLYKNFRTRDELIDAYLSSRHSRTLEALEQIATGGTGVVQQVDAIFDYLASLTRDDVFRGCAFVVAAAEVPDERRPAARWARVHKNAVFGIFHRMFESNGHAEPDLMAERLSILYDGALVTSYVRPESDAVRHARDMAHRLLELG
jgi:AcrR family transcriptional regulator